MLEFNIYRYSILTGYYSSVYRSGRFEYLSQVKESVFSSRYWQEIIKGKTGRNQYPPFLFFSSSSLLFLFLFLFLSSSSFLFFICILILLVSSLFLIELNRKKCAKTVGSYLIALSSTDRTRFSRNRSRLAFNYKERAGMITIYLCVV